jgi:uncharacterized protein YlzI (FlbEa/FlbD family)
MGLVHAADGAGDTKMFIELHTISDGKPLLIGTKHISRIEASPKEGTIIHLKQMQHVIVRESYRDIRNKLLRD